jgi:integrase
MGFVRKQPNGRWRACWREPTGTQKSKSFETKRAASAHLAEIESSINRGNYVDPHAGKRKFGPYAEAWLKGRNDELATAARDASVMRVHILPRWGSVALGKVEHSAVQRWVTDLGQRRSRATVAEALRLTSAVMRSAVRDRIIAFNPCEDVRLPKRRRTDSTPVITPERLVDDLLPEIPHRYRALVALAGGTGLRWGECIGLRWDAVDLDAGEVQVARVIVEVSGQLYLKPYPKSKAGRRTVPMAPYAWRAMREHGRTFPAGPAGEVFRNRLGELPKRTSFRVRVWRPALVRAGLLGKVVQLGDDEYLALWEDSRSGREVTATESTEAAAVERIARSSAGGLRFHDLRHSYATHLVSSGVPINDVQQVMGHEQASTTLDRYTHRSPDRDGRVRGAFDAFSLHEDGEAEEEADEGPSGKGP